MCLVNQMTSPISNFSGVACVSERWTRENKKKKGPKHLYWTLQEVNWNDLTLQRLLCGKHKSRHWQKQLPFTTFFRSREKGQYARSEIAKNEAAALRKEGSLCHQQRSFWCRGGDTFKKLRVIQLMERGLGCNKMMSHISLTVRCLVWDRGVALEHEFCSLIYSLQW